tara:strand:+ start:1779 stop:2216 length:438 start_codon:yes stop_codon:yes gene_type:complete
MSGKYKVRFHLGNGKNHRHWQIIKPCGTREFVNPHSEHEYQIKMFNCRLVNRPSTAKKIYDGECNKTVCSWIECSSMKVIGVMSNLFGGSENPSDNLYEIGTSVELRYNPRKNPFWVHSATNSNVDGHTFRHLFTSGNKVYVKER